MATELQKIIVNTHSFCSKNLHPEPRQRFFNRRPSGDEEALGFHPKSFERGKRATINFAAWRRWQSVELYEYRRNHILR